MAMHLGLARSMQRARLQGSLVSLVRQGSGLWWGRGSSLVAAGVDGADILKAEVPLQVWLNKRSNKAPTGSVHMDLHIIPLAAQ